MNQNQLWKVLLSFVLTLLSPISWASLAHNNQVVIQKDQPQVLRFEFTINPCQMLHQWLAPSLAFDIFLQKYSTLADDSLQKELAKAVKKFETDSFLVQASGVKSGIKLTDVPAAPELKQLLRQNLVILDLPGNLQAHVEPIVLKATVKTKTPLQRAQLFISPSVFPIQVRYQQDVLWLTSLIPMALYDF